MRSILVRLTLWIQLYLLVLVLYYQFLKFLNLLIIVNSQQMPLWFCKMAQASRVTPLVITALQQESWFSTLAS